MQQIYWTLIWKIILTFKVMKCCSSLDSIFKFLHKQIRLIYRAENEQEAKWIVCLSALLREQKQKVYEEQS